MRAKMIGSGWHKQSLRHSNAKRFGRAGGKYADRFYSVKGFSNMVVAKNKNLGEGLSELRVIHGDEDRTGRKIKYGEIFQEKNKNLKLLSQEEAMKKTLLKDSDGDGVPDKLDCQPKNPNKQDTEQQKNFWDKLKEYREKRAERAEQAKTEEHEQRIKEIARLKEEIKELSEKKEAERLLEKEKKGLEELRAERNRLKYEKLKAKAERIKTFLKPVGKFLKEEARYAIKGKTQRRTKKGRRKKTKPLIDLT